MPKRTVPNPKSGKSVRVGPRAKVIDLDEDGGFFTDAASDADFAHWINRHWSLEEATALSLGKDPRVVRREKMDLSTVSRSASGVLYFDRLRQLQRAQKAGALAEFIDRQALAKWASKHRVDLPEPLIKRLSDPEADSTGGSPSNDVQEGNPYDPHLAKRHASTLHTLVLAMAIQKYGLDPTYNAVLPTDGAEVASQKRDKRVSTFAAIEAAVEDVGLGISRKVVKDVLINALHWARENGKTLKPPR